MKILGILLMAIGLFMMVSPVFFPKEKEPEAAGGVMMMKSESLPLASLMGVCFLATGAALVVAGVVTKKK